MKKITILGLLTCSLALAGCSNNSNTKNSKESTIEQQKKSVDKKVKAPDNISGILKTVTFAFKPYGHASYDENTDQIIVDLNIDQSKYSTEDFNKLKDQFKSSAKTSYDSVKTVYKTENPILIKNQGKDFLLVKSGKVTEQ